jgi:hypothetical protein
MPRRFQYHLVDPAPPSAWPHLWSRRLPTRELVPLLLIPKTARQMATLVLVSWVELLVYHHQAPYHQRDAARGLGK